MERLGAGQCIDSALAGPALLFTIAHGRAGHRSCPQGNRHPAASGAPSDRPRPATFVARPAVDKDTSVTKPSAPSQPQHSLRAWGLTACGVVAGPSLFAVVQASPALALASVAAGLTALVIGFALWQRNHPVAAVVPASRRVRTLGWSPP